jgi:transcription antitermination factor NusG
MVVDEIDRASPWYALQVMSRAEREIAEALGRRGIEAYVPWARAMRRIRRVRKPREVVRPVIGGYVFARVDDRRWLVLRQITGIFGAVGVDGTALVVPEAEIARVRAAEAAGVFDRMEAARSRDGAPAARTIVRVGDRVTVYGGVLAGWTGQVVDPCQSGGVRALIDFGPRSALVPLDALTLAA